jgi:hypothetical protein
MDPTQGQRFGVPGTPLEVVAAQERNSTILEKALGPCFERCIYHFGDDSVPYHPGEKTCMDRCMAKIDRGLALATAAREAWQARLKAGQLPEWVAELDREGVKKFLH